MEENFDYEEQVVNLVDDEGNESSFSYIGEIELDGNIYVGLVPVENEDDEYVLLKITQDKDGNEILVTIDDDDEFDRAAEAFDAEINSEIDLDDDCDEDCSCCDHCCECDEDEE